MTRTTAAKERQIVAGMARQLRPSCWRDEAAETVSDLMQAKLKRIAKDYEDLADELAKDYPASCADLLLKAGFLVERAKYRAHKAAA